ncbi:hypothetical protein HY407_04320 [Candidatus Gottesmanbacteria bacterium]|nr:hypothetical protein [Candidatus Gottesmanbacteria bacterium]
MDNNIDKYLISLARKTSLSEEDKNEIIAKIPSLTIPQKAQLKLALLDYLIIDSEEEILTQVSEEKADNMTLEDLSNLGEQIIHKAVEKEDASVSEADRQSIIQSLKSDPK